MKLYYFHSRDSLVLFDKFQGLMTIHRLRLSCNYTVCFQCIQLSNHLKWGIVVYWKVVKHLKTRNH